LCDSASAASAASLFASYSDEIDIWIQVDAFDDNIEKIIPLQKINHLNLDNMLSLLKKMRPRKYTKRRLSPYMSRFRALKQHI
jgi:hypothetical protein